MQNRRMFLEALCLNQALTVAPAGNRKSHGRCVVILAVILTGIFGLSDSVHGQWLDFRDETDSRLTLVGTTLDDGEEKDMVAGDFDSDGWMDVVVVRKVPFSVIGARAALLLMNESGRLMDRTATLAPGFNAAPTNARDVTAVDLTGDGLLDLVVANTFDEQPSFYRNLGVDGGNNWLGFADESTSRFPKILPLNQPAGPKFCAVQAGDLNGDELPDLFFSNYQSSPGTTDVLLINGGGGFFVEETVARLGDHANVAFGTGVELHDVDNDMDLDIITFGLLSM